MISFWEGRNLFGDMGSDMGKAIRGVPPVLDGDTNGSGTTGKTQPISRTHPIATPEGQYVGVIPPQGIDSLQRAFELGPNYSKPHASFQGPTWPDRNAGVLEWLYTGVVWVGGYTVFTFSDFVTVWRDWDGSLLGIFEPNRLLRTLITIGVGISLTYVLPLIDVLIRLSERLYYFVLGSVQWGTDAVERVRVAWAQWMNRLNDWKQRFVR